MRVPSFTLYEGSAFTAIATMIDHLSYRTNFAAQASKLRIGTMRFSFRTTMVAIGIAYKHQSDTDARITRHHDIFGTDRNNGLYEGDGGGGIALV